MDTVVGNNWTVFFIIVDIVEQNNFFYFSYQNHNERKIAGV